MKRNDQNIAKAILASIGGAKNIANISHCSTRLRITPVDKDKVDEAGIEQIDGVKGQFYSGNQLQIILGTGLVGRIYDIINPEEKEGSTD